MKSFIVELREVHVSSRLVQAESAEDALDRVLNGEGDEFLCEYSHTMDRDNHEVREATEQEVADLQA